MALMPATDFAFRHQDARLTVEDTTPYCLYRFPLGWRSSEAFELSNYIADNRRRSRKRLWPLKIISITSISPQLIPKNQLLFLLWCKSSQTVSMLTDTSLQSSCQFEMCNYIADSRRSTNFKICLVQLKNNLPIASQLIPTEQLLFLLWCKSSKTVIISSGNFLPVLSANNIMMNMTTLRVLILTEILSQQLLYLRWIDVG